MHRRQIMKNEKWNQELGLSMHWLHKTRLPDFNSTLDFRIKNKCGKSDYDRQANLRICFEATPILVGLGDELAEVDAFGPISDQLNLSLGNPMLLAWIL